MVRIRPASSWATADISMVMVNSWRAKPASPICCKSQARWVASSSRPRKSSYRSQTRINSTDVLVIKNSGDSHQAVREPSSKGKVTPLEATPAFGRMLPRFSPRFRKCRRRTVHARHSIPPLNQCRSSEIAIARKTPHARAEWGRSHAGWAHEWALG
jgi:hypothetical protein